MCSCECVILTHPTRWQADSVADWKGRTPELFALLAASAPQLQHLEHWYPRGALANPAAALPADLGRLSQLTSLTLGFGYAPVTTVQVDAMLQTLPSLKHLALWGDSSAMKDGFPVSVFSTAAASCGFWRSMVCAASGPCRRSWGA